MVPPNSSERTAATTTEAFPLSQTVLPAQRNGWLLLSTWTTFEGVPALIGTRLVPEANLPDEWLRLPEQGRVCVVLTQGTPVHADVFVRIPIPAEPWPSSNVSPNSSRNQEEHLLPIGRYRQSRPETSPEGSTEAREVLVGLLAGSSEIHHLQEVPLDAEPPRYLPTPYEP